MLHLWLPAPFIAVHPAAFLLIVLCVSMGIVVRQSIKTVVLTYLGVALGLVNTLWLVPLILSKEQLGLVTTLISMAGFFSTFALLGSGSIPNRFFPYFKNEKTQHQGFLFFLLAIGLAGFVLFTLAFLFFRESLAGMYVSNAPMLVHFLYLCVPFTGILIFNTIFEAYLIVQQRPVVPNFTREIWIRSMTFIGLVLMLFKWLTFPVYVTLVVGMYGSGLLILIYYSRKEGLLFLTPNLWIFKSRYFKSISVFSGFVLLGNVSGAILANIDKLMLSAYSGLGKTGIYSIAFLIATVIEIPKRSLSQVLVPMVSAANRLKDTATLEMLYKKSSTNQSIIAGLLFLGIWCNIDNIYSLIPNGDVYVQGKWVVFYVGLAKAFDMVMGINAEILGTSRYYRIDLVFLVILGCVGIAANVILIPSLGTTGAGIASALPVFLFNIMRFIYIFKKYRIHPFSPSTIRIILITAAVIAGNAALPRLPFALADIVCRSLFLTVSFAGLSIYFKVSDDINAVLAKVVRRFNPMR
jgi:O-antigen/teichoic acid export membrane protein